MNIWISARYSIKRGLIAITKTDLVDEEWLQLVTEEITEFSKGSFLEGAPLIPLSSATGEGIPALLTALDTLAQTVEERTSEGIFRLPIDRVFTMKGFGTVLTGTLISGSISVGDNVEILPEKIAAKIRGIQVHSQQEKTATAGLRTAINLQGVEKHFVPKGSILVRPKTLQPTSRIDVTIELLPNAPRSLKNRSRVRFHSGTSEVLAQIILLDQEELAPGGKSLAQFKLEEPVVVLPRDRFVIRNYSPVFTIGGGKILDAHPHKHKRLTQSTITQLRAIQEGSDKENIALFVADSALAGLDLPQLIARVGIEPSRLSSLVHELIIEKKLVLIDKESQKVIAAPVYQELITSILEQLESYHKRFPLNKGMLKEELKSKIPPLVDARLFTTSLTTLVNASHITIEKENLWLTKHQPALKDSQLLLKDRIADIYLKTALTPPSFKELLEQLSSNEKETKSIINLLTGEGVMVKVKENLWFHREALETLKKDLIAYLNKNDEISTTGFKDLTQASRKYTIPLMEYCDQSKITIRVGDKRMLRDKKG